MSLFENKSVCESVQFYSHHIDPQVPNVSGVFSLSNGHTTSSAVPDQAYSLTAVSSTDPSSNNHLQLVGQAGGPSPAVLAMDIAPNGTVNFPVTLQVNGSPIGGGASAQSKQAIVNTSSGFPTPLGNTTTIYTFDLSGCTGNYYQFIFDNIVLAWNTNNSVGVAYDVYISDTLNGAFDATNGCIKYNTGSSVGNPTTNSGPRTMIYKAPGAPTALYLNIVQTTAAPYTMLNNLAFNCEMSSQTVSVV